MPVSETKLQAKRKELLAKMEAAQQESRRYAMALSLLDRLDKDADAISLLSDVVHVDRTKGSADEPPCSL